MPLGFLCSLQSSSKYEYVFGLSAKNSVIIFPPNSSLKRPGIFPYWKRYFILFIIVRRIKPFFNITEMSSKKIFGFNENNKAFS